MKSAMSPIGSVERSSDQRQAPASPKAKRRRIGVWVGAGIAVVVLLSALALGAVGLWLASKFARGAGTPEQPITGGPVQPTDVKGAPPIAPGPASNDAPADKPAAGVVWKGMYVKDGGQDGVTLELTELTRTSDGCLKVSFRVRNATDKPFIVWGDNTKPYYVDPGAKISYPVMCNDNGKLVPHKSGIRGEPVASFSTAYMTAPAHDVSRTYWAKLQGPDDSVRKVTFYFPDFEPIEDVVLPPENK